MKKRQALYAALFFLVISVLLAEFSNQISNKNRYPVNLQKVLYQKKEKTFRLFQKIHQRGDDKLVSAIQKAAEEKIYIFRYYDERIDFWSSNAIPVLEELPDSLLEKRVVRFFNSFYYVSHQQIDSATYIGLIQIKSRYPYTNEFLQSGFEPAFRVPDDATISFEPEKGLPVIDDDNSYLFSIVLHSDNYAGIMRSLLATIFLLTGLLFSGIYVFLLLKEIEPGRKRNTLIISGGIVLVVLRVLQVKYSLHFGGFALFDPFIYADSMMVPSLGDLLVNSFLVALSAVYIISLFELNAADSGRKKIKTHTYAITLAAVVSIYFIYAHYFSHSLIFNSNISFQASRIEKLSIYSLLSYLIHGMNFLAAGMVLIKVSKSLFSKDDLIEVLPGFIITSALIFGVLRLYVYPIDFISIVFFYLISLTVFWLIYKSVEFQGYSALTLFVLAFCTYSLVFFTLKSTSKEAKNRATLAISLSNEHDPVAEYLFEEMTQAIENDTAIIHSLNREEIYIEELADYLQKEYFKGFWNKYYMQITLCGPTDSVLLVSHDYEWFHCYEFFDAIQDEVGFTLPSTRFSYLDLPSGRISYLGRFPYQVGWQASELTLFIELDSKLNNQLLGYPELLLDDRFFKERLIETYSYAKYYMGDLEAQSGDFSYSLTPELFGEYSEGFSEVNLDGYNHLLYSPEAESLVVLSRPQIRFIDLLIGFSYLFLFYYLCLAVYIGIRKVTSDDAMMLLNLRSRIQLSILLILIVSLILIAAGTIWLSVKSYRQNQDVNLHEKIQSVLIELTHKLEFEEELAPDWHTDKYYNLNQLLIKFSDVFYSDINLYDPQGNLLATSRPEIFQLGLQGEKMDPVAFYRLKDEKRAQFIQREKISDLSYLSAYVPFYNADGELLAYLNLPYFTKQKDLQASITALVVTIVNIYVILILITIVITILISDQITRPLELLQLRFRELKLGGRYEKIKYRRKDEIGNLVAEYNRMVSELEQSVNLLARSERESAWREMAKQIAHEIKNPLTPMRLGIQHLQRAWKDQRDDFDKQLNSLSQTLIEQIDNLSAIASEFSNFAKMPVAKMEDVNLVSIVKSSVGLFEGSSAYSISYQSKLESATIRADEKQLSRLFINLIKNAIQSIPENRQGKIEVGIKIQAREYVVDIADNGKGIPEEIRTKMFMPNFTTKSSGMGLGLAIVRNILDSIGGKISFESKVGEGTRFILTFPVVE